MTRRPIELKRRFLEADEEEADFSRAVDPEWLELCEWPMGWEALLERRCVVVLGEAGAGKTTEFQLRAEELNERGQAVFFIPLAELAAASLPDCLSARQLARLAAWRSSAEDAWFFLDALDLARLGGRDPFVALRRLRRHLGPELGRAHLLISCRTSDWRDRADKRSIREALGGVVAEEGGGAGPHRRAGGEDRPVFVVDLAPLDRRQVRLLACHFGLSERGAEVFHDQLLLAGVGPYASRPADVGWLVAYWQERATFDSLTGLIVRNIDEKLGARAPGRSPGLPLSRAWQGAETLAGITTLLGEPSILLPRESAFLDQRHPQVDPRPYLKDWTVAELEDLLALPLFTTSSRGAVRFHHDSLQGYLGARWLFHLVEAGLKPDDLQALLFPLHPDLPVGKALASAVGWLSALLPEVRQVAMQEAPELLMEEGDSRALTIVDRREVLRGWALRAGYDPGALRELSLPGLRRLAAAGLGEVLRELLAPDQPTVVRGISLDMIRAGAIRDCALAAERIALNEAEPLELRCAAVQAVAAASTRNRHAILVRKLTCAEVDGQLLGAMIGAFFPSTLGVAGLLELLGTPRRPSGWAPNLDEALDFHVPDKSSKRERLALLSGLVALRAKIPSWEPGPGSFESAGLGRALQLAAALVVRELLDGDGDRPLSPVLRDALAFLFDGCLQDAVDDEEEAEPRSWLRGLVEALAEHESVRRTLFWHWVRERRQEGRQVATRMAELFDDRELCRLYRRDARWLLLDLQEKPSVLDRRVALDALLRLALARLLAPPRLPALRRAVAGDPALEAELARWEQQQGFGEEPDCVAGEEAVCRPERAPGWQELNPSSRCEALPGREDSSAALIGLLGIAVDPADGLDFWALTAPQAERAARHAAATEGRFPDWLDTLVACHPETVTAVLREALTAACLAIADQPGLDDVLGKMARASEALRQASAPLLLELLEQHDPPRVQVLGQLLDCLLRTPSAILSSLEEVAQVRRASALERLRTTRGPAGAEEVGRDPQSPARRFGWWWLCAFHVSSPDMVDELELLLHTDSPEGKVATAAALDRLCDSASQHPATERVLSSDAFILRRLYDVAAALASGETGIEASGPLRQSGTAAKHVLNDLARRMVEAEGAGVLAGREGSEEGDAAAEAGNDPPTADPQGGTAPRVRSEDVARAIEAHLRLHGPDAVKKIGQLEVGRKIEDAEQLVRQLGAATFAFDPPHPTFRRFGAIWYVWFDGKATTFRHTVGVEYVARLLDAPFTELSSLDLSTHGLGDSSQDPGPREKAPAEVRRKRKGQTLDVRRMVDDDTLSSSREELEELREELAEAERQGSPDAESLREKGVRLAQYMSSVSGRSGRPRLDPDEGEKARAAVSKDIGRVLAEIAESHESLAEHLRRHLHPGRVCIYTPQPPVTWTVVSK